MAVTTIRGKMVRLRNVEVNVRVDGSLHLEVRSGEHTHTLLLTEADASDLYEILDDVTQWGKDDDAK